jgi:adenine-specific DNA-methyltransferase
VIFISCDDNEQAYLKVLADEIFGNDNFIATTPWRKRTAKSDVPFGVSQDFEWIVGYAKSSDFQAKIEGKGRKYYTTDDLPNRPWRVHDLTKQTTAKERPKSFFTITNPKTGEEYPANPNRTWAITHETFQGYYDKQRIVFPGDYDFLRISKPALRYFEEDDKEKAGENHGFVAVSTLLPQTVGMTKEGTAEITQLFDSKLFAFPKPEGLISHLISIATEEGDLVLDFCLGSGTTSAVAHKMNRRWVGIEQMDYIETVAKERLIKVVEGEQGGVSKSVDWSGGGSFVYLQLKQYNQEYVDRIMRATSLSELEDLYVDMRNNAFLKFWFDRHAFEKDEDFRKLVLDKRKEALVDVLDENQLYLNYADMYDTRHEVTADEKTLTDKFYGKTEN